MMLDQLRGKRGLLIHHWDTDGICSAALLLQRLGENVVNKTPLLGNYFLTEDELTAYSSGYEFVIVADMALPEDNIRRLASSSQVFIFDHHLQPLITGVFHENPISRGESPEKYPSASWIINTFLGNQVNLYALLGVVGDHEERIESNKNFNSILLNFCLQHQVTFKEMLAMVYLLDSNYKMGDRRAVMEAPRFLLGTTDSRGILRYQPWKKHLAELEDEISKWVGVSGEVRKGVCLKRISTKYNIISTVTRRVFWSLKTDTVVVNTGFSKETDQVYVRSGKNLQGLIEVGKSQGFKCGGKAEVLGAIVPKGKTEDFVSCVIDVLSSHSV
jgi:hypothetical protein